MTTREQVIQAARQWVGTPFVLHARVRGVGADCPGFVIGLARELGLVDAGFDVTGYTTQSQQMLELCGQHMLGVPIAQAQPGDVAVFRVQTRIQHMGILTPYKWGGLALVHALDEGQRGVVEHRLDPAGRLRMVAAFQLPGVA